MKKYFPIFVAKAGEFTALAKLTQTVKDGIAPIIQSLNNSHDKILSFAQSNWSFPDNQLFLDVSLEPDTSISVIKKLLEDLLNEGVNVVPVIQTNSRLGYATMLQSLVSRGLINQICIRFSQGTGGFNDLDNRINGILSSVSLKHDQASILIDLGSVNASNYQIRASAAHTAISSLSNKANYLNIILASSSFPENLSGLTPAGQLHSLKRFEWLVWQILIGESDIKKFIKYSDYGTKHCVHSDAGYQGTCSIKYTIEEEYLIYRGELSGNHPEGNGQYIIFSKELIVHPEYKGVSFSWGDERIKFFASQILSDRKRKTGNSTNWVEISQNHHLTIVHSLL